ncbi:hypothetical protein G647_03934 [Cladophialophora carrionii CBS 160.54]|uniref:Uncharacterized protein n=1 Tax=Cladophialophora carrionii CBS 160.54 TaxID=1279043 RepID=V9DCI8_9EURO|nr:uncharacterized protein G647_03934 [Cladophialophora carrionii CBS 160.54]ETI24565.1 hypothetical protein G647_03934 [Cladophialophora carrionii CBS 160.54]
MQRAAAASPTTSAAASSTTHTPATEPSSKRRRVESTTSSPVTSIPGTPMNELPNGLASPTMARGGVSTFRREEADTEWVLDVKVQVPQYKGSDSARKTNRDGNTALNRFNALGDQHEEGEASSSEDDIWTAAQPSGRQTFGTFRKRKSRIATPSDRIQADGDEDLSSASDADDHSESDDESGSDRSSDSHTARGHQTPTSHGKRRSHQPKDVNSDEEMRQVRQAIEQKHRNMRGTAMDHPKAKQGNKRKGREQGSYKKRKKARKTI